jgi:predicted nuclease of predicted toxin-antitoxin system
MRFLADAGISPTTVEFLKQLGHDTTHIRTLGLQRASDTQVIELARAEDRIVLSFDLDFGDILALGVTDKPSVILFRLSDERAQSVNARLPTVLNEQIAQLETGALILVEDARYRVRKLPIRRP